MPTAWTRPQKAAPWGRARQGSPHASRKHPEGQPAKTDPLHFFAFLWNSLQFDASPENGAAAPGCSGGPWACWRTYAGHGACWTYSPAQRTNRCNTAANGHSVGRRRRPDRTNDTRSAGAVQPSARALPGHAGQPAPAVRKRGRLGLINVDQPPEGLEVLAPSPQLLLGQPGYCKCTDESSAQPTARLHVGELQALEHGRSVTPVLSLRTPVRRAGRNYRHSLSRRGTRGRNKIQGNITGRQHNVPSAGAR